MVVGGELLEVEAGGGDGAFKMVVALFVKIDDGIADACEDIAFDGHRPVVFATELSVDFQRSDADELVGDGVDVLMQEVDDSVGQQQLAEV